MSSLLKISEKDTSDEAATADIKISPKSSNRGLSWKNIDIEVLNNNKKYHQKRIKLISNASGVIESGMLAIMGPSGSGKTTLLNAFVGRIPQGSCTTGQILLNGKPRDSSWTSMIGFVDQDDTVYEVLTARETIKYSAKFRLRNKKINIDEKIDYIARKLGIFHILKNKMKSVSGGERKRVMIAVELITDPQIIFLDEPTSGLDNNTALKLIRLLKSISDDGKLVILTIHQPDDITAMEFQKLLLLSQGRSVYMGDFNECQSYIESKGFKRGQYETFSNFAMKTLDVEQETYFESLNDPILNEMISFVAEQYDTNETEKRKRFSNELYLNYRFDFRDFIVLFKRRFKLYLSKKKFILTQLIMCLFASYLLYKSKNSDSKLDLFLYPTDLKFIFDKMQIYLADLSKKDIIALQHPGDYFLNILLRFPIVFAAAPIDSGFAFTLEHTQVKREMGVNSYSITSYYLSVLISEYILCSPPIITILLGSLYVFKDRIFPIIDTSMLLLTYMTIVPFYLLSGSLFKNHKISQMTTSIFGILCVFPITFFILSAKTLAIDKEYKIWHVALDFLPNHLVAVLCSITYSEKCRKSLLEIAEKKFSKSKVDLESFKKQINRTCDGLKDSFKATALYKLKCSSLIYVLLISFVSLYVCLTLLFLGLNLRQQTRFKLNG